MAQTTVDIYEDNFYNRAAVGAKYGAKEQVYKYKTFWRFQSLQKFTTNYTLCSEEAVEQEGVQDYRY